MIKYVSNIETLLTAQDHCENAWPARPAREEDDFWSLSSSHAGSRGHVVGPADVIHQKPQQPHKEACLAAECIPVVVEASHLTSSHEVYWNRTKRSTVPVVS